VAEATGGFNFGNGFRVELEFDYHRTDIDTFEPSGGDRKTNLISSMVDAHDDFQLGCAFMPFQGMGFDWANAALSALTP